MHKIATGIAGNVNIYHRWRLEIHINHMTVALLSFLKAMRNTSKSSQCLLVSPHETIIAHDNAFYRVVSIDPAVVNFGYRMCDRYGTEEQYHSHVNTLSLKREKFSKDVADGRSSLLSDITEFLRKETSVGGIDIVLIEKQLPSNPITPMIESCVVSFFLAVHREARVFLVNSKLKAKLLGGPIGCGKVVLKKWSVDCAIVLIDNGNDTECKRLWNLIKGKKDDVADTITQEEAAFRYFGLPMVVKVAEFC